MKKIGIGLLIALVLSVFINSLNLSTATASQPQFSVIKAYKEIGNNKADLIQYKTHVKEKIIQIDKSINDQETVLVTITFNKPLEKNQLAKLVQQYNLNVLQVTGRAIEKETGLRATIVLTPENGSLFDENILEHMLSYNKSLFKGFIEIVSEVDKENLIKLSDDSAAFLVDPSADNYFVSNPKEKSMPGVFWNLEDYELVAQ